MELIFAFILGIVFSIWIQIDMRKAKTSTPIKKRTIVKTIKSVPASPKTKRIFIPKRKMGFYKKYIQSDEWKALSKRIRERDGKVCRLCNQSDVRLHVHHSTYERLGKERDSDLITVCEICHKKIHN